MAVKFAFYRALKPLTEPVKWTQDRSPHAEGVFGAVVLHGEDGSENAGAPNGSVPAHPWTVLVAHDIAMAAAVRVGDTLDRIEGTRERLTVQLITRDDVCWVMRCTSDERSPV